MNTLTTKGKIYNSLPMEIKTILINSDGWLVGSSIKSILDDEPVNDYDIIVPVLNWHKTMINLRDYPFELNTFGGMKFSFDELTIDIWPEDFDNFLKKALHFTYLYNLPNQILLENV